MEVRKKAKKVMLGTLTIGAAAGVGFLSFSGVMALTPFMPVGVAVLAFMLAVGYDGEIFSQNVKGGFKKIFKSEYLERQVAKRFLEENFADLKHRPPLFFKEYQEQCELLQLYEGKSLTTVAKQRKKQIKTTLKDMEKWFTKQLFATDKPTTRYQAEVRSYINQQIAKQYIQHILATQGARAPAFFRDYQTRCLVGASYKLLNGELDDAEVYDLQRREKWLAQQLFTEEAAKDDKERQMRAFISQHPYDLKPAHSRLKKIKRMYPGFMIFSLLAGAFTVLGTSYLLVEAFGILLPLLSISAVTPALPFIVVPLAVLAGVAYTLQTLHSTSDLFVHHETPQHWWNAVKKGFREKKAKGTFFSLFAIGLFVLAIFLAACVTLSWWTIITTGTPIFGWMVGIPLAVIVVGSVFTFLSTVIFSIENTSETLKDLEEEHQGHHEHVAIPLKQRLKNTWTSVLNKLSNTKETIQKLREEGRFWHAFNIPRGIFVGILYLVMPILFIGHLVSMAATGDQVPGINEWGTALANFAGELFEDLHYFRKGHTHNRERPTDPTKLAAWQREMRRERLSGDAGHDHDGMNIPKITMLALLSPLILAGALWDIKFGPEKLTRKNLVIALWRQLGLEPQDVVEPPVKTVEGRISAQSQAQTSPQLKLELANMMFKKQQARLSSASGDNEVKVRKQSASAEVSRKLTQLNPVNETRVVTQEALNEILQKAKENSTFGLDRHGLLARKTPKRCQQEVDVIAEKFAQPCLVSV